MHHIISNIDKTINLQQYIDNREGNKRIGLKSITYGIGWYNVINQRINDKIEDGYYSFQQISDLFEEQGITLTVNETNGIASMISPNEIRMSKDLKNMLGFDIKGKISPNETHTGTKSIDFAIYKMLYIHLNQLNTSYNYFNGSPSTILASIPIVNKEFGDIVTTKIELPEYKCLSNGTISELKLEIRDENNKKIINHFPTSCVLEIK